MLFFVASIEGAAAEYTYDANTQHTPWVVAEAIHSRLLLAEICGEWLEEAPWQNFSSTSLAKVRPRPHPARHRRRRRLPDNNNWQHALAASSSSCLLCTPHHWHNHLFSDQPPPCLLYVLPTTPTTTAPRCMLLLQAIKDRVKSATSSFIGFLKDCAGITDDDTPPPSPNKKQKRKTE